MSRRAVGNHRLRAAPVPTAPGGQLELGDRLADPRVAADAIVSQPALPRCARHTPVAAAQLRQLVDRAAWPNIELRVLPFDLGLHVGVSGPFSLLSFPDQLLADVEDRHQ
jgi:hypothetical protein